MRAFQCLSAVLATLVSGAAGASSSGPGYVVQPTITNTNATYFVQDGARTTPPACATDPRYVLDPSASGTASQLAALLTASAGGRKITVQGNGFCLSGTNNETVAWIVIAN